MLDDEDVLENVHETTNGPTVTLPNGETLTSTRAGYLPLPAELSTRAKKATLLKNLKSSTLISFGQLCDDGCEVILKKKVCDIYKNNKIILRGTRNLIDGLWDIPLIKQPTVSPPPKLILPSDHSDHKLNVIIRKDKTKMELAQFLHASCFGPTKSSWLKAISNNHFLSWPGLTSALVRKSLPLVDATECGHINQERRNLQSTKQSTPQVEIKIEDDDSDADAFPLPDSPNIKTRDLILSVVDMHKIDNNSPAYIDLAGRFPITSTSGNQYILVAYHWDANAILAEPIKNRKSATILKAWQKINSSFLKSGHPPNIYIMDNEASGELKQAMTNESIDYQLVPPHCHRRNRCERAIQTVKRHFKTGLALCDPKFPIREWDRLLPQCIITLNLLRASRSNPRLSAHAYLFSNFDYNCTPLAPPGIKVVAHTKPGVRKSWDLNGEIGWYVGPSTEHYRCVKCYFPRTRATRNCDTVTFMPQNFTMPELKTEDHLRQCALDIIVLLQSPPSPSPALSLQMGNEEKNAIATIAEIFN